MRFAEIVREAWWNTISGASAAVLWGITFGVVVLGLSGFEVARIDSLIKAVDRFVAAGGTTWIMEAPDGIDAKACDSLTSVGGIAVAGSVGRESHTVLPNLPMSPVPTFGVSRGWWDGFLPPTLASSSLVASEELAGTLDPRLLKPRETAHAGDATIDGAFSWPDDGRRAELRYALIAREPRPIMDQCWVRTLDPTANPSLLLRSVVKTSPGGDQQSQVLRLNGSLGEFDGFGLYEGRETRNLWVFAGAIGVALALASIRLRALELSHGKAVGVALTDQLAQLLMETAIWVFAGLLLALSSLVLFVSILGGNPALAWSAMPILVAGGNGVLAGVPLGVSLVRRCGVDHYIRRRSG